MYFAMLLSLVLLGAALLQASFDGWAVLGFARPPLLLATVLYYALNYPRWIGIITAFCAGMLLDAMSFVPLGYSAFLFSLIALIAGHYQKLVLSEAVVTATVFGGISGFLLNTLLYILLTASGTLKCGAGSAALQIFGATLLSVLTVPPVFLLLKAVHNGLDLRQKEDGDV